MTDEEIRLERKLQAAGSPDFDVSGYLAGDFGARQKHLLLDEAGSIPGVRCDVHVEYGGWSAWLPADMAEDALPALVAVYNETLPMHEMERYGFAQITAKERFIYLAVQQGNNLDAVLGSLSLACERYPIDVGRVYIAGHSFGGSAASRHAIRSPRHFAGVCLLGTSYYGADNTSEEIMAAGKIGLPMVSVCGSAEVNGVLPYNRDPQGGRGAPPRLYPDVTPPYHTAANCLAGLAMWRQINGCSERSFAEDCEPRSDIEAIIGARFDHTETRLLFGRRHFIGEENGIDDQPVLRITAVDGGPHCVAPTAAPIAWAFLSQFSRDARTGQIQRERPDRAYSSITAETAYIPRGQAVNELRLVLQPGVDVSDLIPEDFEILAFTDMHPVLHPKAVMALDRSRSGLLAIQPEAFLLDGTAPRYGYIDGAPGKVTQGHFTLHCRKRPGGKSLDFSRADVSRVVLEHPGRYKNGFFRQDGLMAFDYVYFRSPRADAGERLPLVFYSVGSGNKNNEAGNQQILNFGAARMAEDAFQAIYPCHILAPWFPLPGHPPQGREGNAQLEAYARSTQALVRHFAEESHADQARIYFIGTGGGALYQHLAADPTLYAAAAMLTSVFDYFADGSEIDLLAKLHRLPIYISHAASDYPCPVRRSRLAYAKLLEFGNRDVYYREYTDEELTPHGIDVSNLAGSHDSPRVDLADPGFYRWLFSHRKGMSSQDRS